jgi:hypothetical protein
VFDLVRHPEPERARQELLLDEGEDRGRNDSYQIPTFCMNDSYVMRATASILTILQKVGQRDWRVSEDSLLSIFLRMKHPDIKRAPVPNHRSQSR